MPCKVFTSISVLSPLDASGTTLHGGDSPRCLQTLSSAPRGKVTPGREPLSQRIYSPQTRETPGLGGPGVGSSLTRCSSQMGL